MNPLFIIAEAGSNWRCGTRERDRAMGKALIEVAAEARASAVKFQLYRASSVYAVNAGGLDDHCGTSLEDIHKTFEDLELSDELLVEFAEYSRACQLEFMCTPFSVADFEKVGPLVQTHKLASYEMQHIRIWEAMIASGKPVVFSTGGFTLDDVDSVVDWLIESNAPVHLYTVMHCVAAYPAPLSSLGLGVIRRMKDRYGARGLSVGYSDHSLDCVTAPAAAVALGATCIEKHFTLDRRLPGPDHPFAITASELKSMVQACRDTFDAVQETHAKGEDASEERLRRFAHRALQSVTDINPGDILTEGLNFDILRPGNNPKGASPLSIASVDGKRASRRIRAGEGIDASAVVS